MTQQPTVTAQLCDNNGIALGKDYRCTGGAHIAGAAIVCGSPFHKVRPVPSPEDRMRDARTDTPPTNDPAPTHPGRSFRTWMSDTDRDQLDARAATAEGERDEALDARDQARRERDQNAADNQAIADNNDRLRRRLAGLEADLRSQNRAVLEVTAERDRHRQELGAAGEVLAVVRDAAERIDRALAVYDTTPGELAERVDTPHEDPSRLREQLAEAHADCARYATERDEARAALANPLHKAAEHLRLLAEDHGIDSLGFGIGWAADALDAWAKTPDEAAPPSSVPPRRAQEDEPESDARRLLDQAIESALPQAGGNVRPLLKALRRELKRVDAKRAERAEREG